MDNSNKYSVADEIIKLKSLLDSGVLTQEEFDRQKHKLLDYGCLSETDAQENDRLYKIILLQDAPARGFLFNLNYLSSLAIVSEYDTSNKSLPFLIGSGLSLAECKMIQEKLSAYDCVTKIELDTTSSAHNPYLSQREIITTDTEKKLKNKNNALTCPKCGSASITTGARGVNWKWGLIGADKTVNRCANCGHTWKPRG